MSPSSLASLPWTTPSPHLWRSASKIVVVHMSITSSMSPLSVCLRPVEGHAELPRHRSGAGGHEAQVTVGETLRVAGRQAGGFLPGRLHLDRAALVLRAGGRHESQGEGHGQRESE